MPDCSYSIRILLERTGMESGLVVIVSTWGLDYKAQGITT